MQRPPGNRRNSVVSGTRDKSFLYVLMTYVRSFINYLWKLKCCSAWRTDSKLWCAPHGICIYNCHVSTCRDTGTICMTIDDSVYSFPHHETVSSSRVILFAEYIEMIATLSFARHFSFDCWLAWLACLARVQFTNSFVHHRNTRHGVFSNRRRHQRRREMVWHKGDWIGNYLSKSLNWKENFSSKTGDESERERETGENTFGEGDTLVYFDWLVKRNKRRNWTSSKASGDKVYHRI